MTDDKLKAAEKLVRLMKQVKHHFGIGEAAKLDELCDAILPEPELPSGVYRCNRDGHDAVLVVADDGLGHVVDTADAFASLYPQCKANLTEIQPLHPPDEKQSQELKRLKHDAAILRELVAKLQRKCDAAEKPPAPQELMERMEDYLESLASNLIPREPASELLAAVRRHTDPELPGKLRQLAVEAKNAEWFKDRVVLENKLAYLADELEGKP